MKIILITPAGKQSKTGNRSTAVRWARLLRGLGHSVIIQETWDGSRADSMVALHAWRSAESIAQFTEKYPASPLVVALTGTDIYRFQQTHPIATLRSMEQADALVCLHGLVHKAIPEKYQRKLHVIYQSARPLKTRRRPSVRHFDVCVIGHLREEKDPLRAAYAARGLSETSLIRIRHLGRAHNDEWRRKAKKEMQINPRYHWLGEVTGGRIRQEFAKTQVMILSSIMEGGANVLSEAVVAGVPVIASDIDGNVGLLGADYPGYYPVKDTDALREMLEKAETDKTFLRQLIKHGKEGKKRFTPGRERAAWKTLLNGF